MRSRYYVIITFLPSGEVDDKNVGHSVAYVFLAYHTNFAVL